MSKDKYPGIFSPQMEAIVFIILQIFFATRAVLNIGTQGVQELFFCDLKAPGGCSTRWTHKGNSFICTGVPDSSQCH